jgi:ribose transport system substrate-binding protein
VGLWNYNAPSAIMVLKDYPQHGVKVVGFDEDIETLEAIRRGQMVCSVAQNPYEIGYQSIKMLSRLHQKQDAGIPSNKLMYIPVRIINKQNVDDIEKDINFKLSKLQTAIKNY